MAVAGFKPAELSVVSEGVTLTVSGDKQENGSDHYFYRGIAGRSFKRTFHLAEYIKVEGSQLENGLLSIDLKREIPEAMKPRKVPITTTGMKAVPFSAAA
jgi:molecular chaperone IbpA